MRSKKQIIHIMIVAVLLLSAQAFASGRISEFQYVDGHVELTIETTADKRYQILCCTDLAEGEWVSVRGFIATSDTTVQILESSASSCFFRVEEVEEAPITPPRPTPPPTEPPPLPS